MTLSSCTLWPVLPVPRDNSTRKTSPNSHTFRQSKMYANRWEVDCAFTFLKRWFPWWPLPFRYCRICKLLFWPHLQRLYLWFRAPFFLSRITFILAGIILNWVKSFWGLESCLTPFMSMIRSSLGKISCFYYLNQQEGTQREKRFEVVQSPVKNRWKAFRITAPFILSCACLSFIFLYQNIFEFIFV